MFVRQEVIETIDRLFVATDTKDWKAVRECFDSKVRFDMSSAGGGPERERTGEEIAAEWERNLEPIRALHHQAGNYRVSAEGNRAEAF
ncbi:MAG TPA: nuclear transport factor 2 family protein, partial [Gemmatimonadaceae bacterium]|nr:nuclear transport factor 2 family protein [Gemmatimonadaceae bacterium]